MVGPLGQSAGFVINEYKFLRNLEHATSYP
jgi:hypothetical protein